MGGTITEIIDDFNKILCWPTKESLLKVLLILIDSPEERERMLKRGWETSQRAFGLSQCQSRWKSIICEITDDRR